jgi:phage/plasmid-like protein (TIGR03299 family)
MPANVESMFSAREVPWHGLGTVTADVLTAQDALVVAGLDWQVEKRPCYAIRADGNAVAIPDKFAMVRTCDETVLGIVGGTYKPIQNVEAFKFADNLVDNGAAKYETAGALNKGRQVFLSMKVGTELLIGGEDAIDLYIMFRNGHDGTKALGAYVTPIRVVCSNTLTLGIAVAKQRWEMTHRQELAGKVDEAREALKLTFAYAKDFVLMGDQLISTKVSEADVKRLLEGTLPALPKTEEVIADITALYNDSPTTNYQGTAWGLFNAVTEFYDHGRTTTSDEARFNAIIDGNGAKWRDRLVKNIYDMKGLTPVMSTIQ